ncbi:MAG: CAAD domain-containing protein [Vulcanococcus sp.]
MADAPAPQPDAEQQPEGEALEVQATETVATTETVESELIETEPETAAEPTVEVAPEPEPTPAPEPEPVAAAEPVNAWTPQVASTTDVPASPTAVATATEGEGGEWELLVEKVKQWIASGQLQQQWQTARTPITLVAGLIGLLLVLRIYGALLGVVESVPLLPGLLELVGVISVVRFSLTRLVKSDDRHQVIDGLKQRWSSFRGQR